MSVGAMFSLWGVWLLAVTAPGPDVVVVLQRSLLARRHGLAAGFGVVCGVSVWVVTAFAGLSAVVARHPGLMLSLRLVGGLILVWLGVAAMRGGLAARRGGHEPGEAEVVRRGGDFARGLLTNLSNPKALVFFGAVLTPFLSGRLPVAQSVLVVCVMIGIAAAWFTALAVAASHPAVLRRIERWLPTVDIGCGVVFVVLGVAFVVSALVSHLS